MSPEVAVAVPLRALLDSAAGRLREAGVASPRADAEALLMHVLGVSRVGLLLLREVGEEDCAAYEGLVARRASRVPLQHLTGEAPFRTLLLAVGPGVFVPRPETEVLAGVAVDEVRGLSGGSGLVVDACAGSGAVGLAVAAEVGGARVVAVEADPRAADWAVRNVARTGLGDRCSVVTGDVADLGRTLRPDLVGRVDVVVANPPYVPDNTPVAAEVGHDPAMAVWGGPDGLATVRHVVAAAHRLLRPGGLLAVEHHDDAGSAVRELCRAPAWRERRTVADLTGRGRVTVARRAGGEA